MKRIMGTLALVAGLALATPAAAQSTEEADSAVNQPGRYLAVPTTIDGQALTLMVDTVFGRTWVMIPKSGGSFVWRRVFFENSPEPPEGLDRSPPRRTK